MPHPPLDEHQTAQALAAYASAREQAVRYALAQLDATAFDAPALPYLEVLTRVQDLLAGEIARYTAQAEEQPGTDEAQAEEQRESQDG